MEVDFLGQPYRDWPCAASFISRSLEDPTVKKLLILTAWVRESGLREIEPGLCELKLRGGTIELYVGVDLKGTSIQGLELARQLATRIHVVHDPEGRTFHPKVYLARGKPNGYALVGSSNLTAGGMSYNYEGSLGLTFPAGKPPGFVRGVEKLARRLEADGEIAKRLTPGVMKRLLAEGWLADEEKDRTHRSEDRTRSAKAKAGSLFGPSSFEKRSSPRGSRRGRSQAGATTPAKASGSRARGSAVRAPDSWWKKMNATDAQRPSQGNATGVVRLTGPPVAKDRARFFRRVFFADQKWKVRRDSEGNRLEVATLEVEVSIGSASLGTREVLIDYGKYRDVRGRATTVLHWGELLDEIVARDLIDHFLLIERQGSSYKLSIETAEPA